MAKNVLGTDLECCCDDPVTGFYRNGKCDTGPEDDGMHTVCVVLTAEFLSYSQDVGNDLSTPIPTYGFPGLKEGNRWCLCMERWKQAYEDDMAPQVSLKGTHISVLEHIDLALLKEYAVDFEEKS